MPADPTPRDHPRRLFTVDEANALLPELTRVLTAMRAAAAALEDARRALGRLTETMRANGSAARATDLEARIRSRADDLATHGAWLRERGIELKGVADGIVDFPARRDDRVVFLCWRLGEPVVAFWHETDAGFAGRRPLE